LFPGEGFLPAIVEIIDALCTEQTWILRVSDKDLLSFH